MIENDHQLQITQTKLKEFEETLAYLCSLPTPTKKKDKLDTDLAKGSLIGFIAEFKEEIAAYLEQTAL